MCISNASMCSNIIRCSQYIVMDNTGMTDLEISEQNRHNVGTLCSEHF